MSEMINEQEKKVKKPENPNKKALARRLITIIGGSLGIVFLIAFAVLFLNQTATVTFSGYGEKYASSMYIDKETYKVELYKDLKKQYPDKSEEEIETLVNEELTPTRKHFDFGGWYLDEKFNGEPINFAKQMFYANKKRFGWFGKEEKLPEATTVYAKWNQHKYLIKILDKDTKEAIVDEEENTVEFYIYSELIMQKEYDNFISEYLAQHTTDSSTPEEVDEINKVAKILAGFEELEIKYITNIEELLEVYDVESIDKLLFTTLDEVGNYNKIEKIDRSNSSELLSKVYDSATKTYKVDENGKEIPIITIYVEINAEAE